MDSFEEPLLSAERKKPTMREVMLPFGIRLEDTMDIIVGMIPDRKRRIGEPGAEDPRMVIAYAICNMQKTGSQRVLMWVTSLKIKDFEPYLRELDGAFGPGTELSVTPLIMGDMYTEVYALDLITPACRAKAKAQREEKWRQGAKRCQKDLAGLMASVVIACIIFAVMTALKWRNEQNAKP